MIQTQRIHHELERQFLARHCMLGLHWRALGHLFQISLGLLVACLTNNLVVKAQLAVRPRAYAQIIAKLPVVQIVARLLFRKRKGRCLVVLVSLCCQQLLDALLHGAAHVIIRQGWGIAVEQRVRLQRQVVTG